jgi:cysteine desulfurase
MIYLDNNATTRCDPQVLDIMLPFLSDVYANAGNPYNFMGRQAANSVDEAREKVAELINAEASSVIFTAGSTESNNIAIKGILDNFIDSSKRNKIIASAIEHKAVLNIMPEYERAGFEVVVLPVDEQGVFDLDFFNSQIDEKTILVSLQLVNNEIGTIEPIKKMAERTHEVGAVFHSDGTQGVGKIPIDIEEIGIDLFSMSAHKFYGPKGVGALVFRNGAMMKHLQPQFFGGGQEKNLRPGTKNVPGIVGMGEAARIAKKNLPLESKRIEAIRDRFEFMLLNDWPDKLSIHAQKVKRIPNTSSIEFQGYSGEEILLSTKVFAAGLGSACSSRTIAPSHVLTAIGLNREQASSTIRFSFGRFNTEEEIDLVVKELNRLSSHLAF